MQTPTNAQSPATGTSTPQACVYQSTSIISYSNTVSKIMTKNCYPCHQTPGSGGINLDSYAPTKALAQGELMDVITYNPGNIQMPPPPQKLLDSCEIKALNLWIKQGCLFN